MKPSTITLHSDYIYNFMILMTRTNLFIRYFLLINLFTFFVRGVDKYKASAHKRRISEKNLLRFTGFGGRLGAVLGMQAFRHKTTKGNFLTKFWLIAGVWIIVTIVLLFSL
ncbi:MAG: DUF1294 domain-containing protein [Candidatus Absconditabacterales bacterium]